ncbi:MAG: ABC-type transport auxiliary lipoprotein family protein [Rhodocyclaceae bacterium]|nr:ABC-type transport auxiliary lipoprotein family protein [Rhodocyclaceae bacterium]MDZ4214217.1 ABC-type transport auxiliary lipoprotein family protein [Rhodocyclaceae bacterium]
MRIFLILLSSLLLTACIGIPSRQSDLALYDLGQMTVPSTAPTLPIATLNVSPSPWLDSPALLYRFNFADDLRRQTYVDSRWAAPPAELFKRHLQRQIVYGQSDAGGGGCRLELTLDELEQQFESAQQSHVIMEVRAGLHARHGEDSLARKVFRMQSEAPTPDARGGVQATRSALKDFSVELTNWLNRLAKSRPKLCRSKG